MKRWFGIIVLLLGCLECLRAADETVFIFQNRKISIAVPEGLGFASGKDDRGLITVRIGHPKAKISLELTFLPDAESQLSAARGRKEFMHETFSAFVGSSTEKAMQFEELEPRVGAGTYCVFTDASLVGKKKLPPGEYLHSTAGLKCWPGVAAVFTLFSNDTRSKEYQALMAMLRESVVEKPVPLR